MTAPIPVSLLAALGLVLGVAPAGANFIIDVIPSSVPPFSTLTDVFPNWKMFPAGAFMVRIGDDAVMGAGWCETSEIVGVTIYNYGSAGGSAPGGGGDVQGVYFHFKCNATDSGVRTMTYAGAWTVGVQVYPAWTWAGSLPIVNDPSQPPGGGSKGCGIGTSPAEGAGGLYVYADIGPCPADAATVQLGLGYNDLLNPGCPGGLNEWATTYGWGCGCGNWSDVRDATIKTIRYVLKRADRESAPPGDTINYTIYYGKPGTAMITDLWITDTKPDYTHLLDPPGPSAPGVLNPGPPPMVWWRLTNLDPTGGATGEVTFSVTVDFGRDSMFDVDGVVGGDVGAPEGEFLGNRVHMAWAPAGTCGSGRVSGELNTVVRRFLFWKIGDNDLLYAGTPGMAPDEMTYEIFLKNTSSKKTWWDVRIWDTVPGEIDPWGPGSGFYDPFIGWTMTPTGAAAASPGWLLTGPKSETTLLTWRVDMPPGLTLGLRWKAKVRSSAVPGDVAVNEVAVLEQGRTGLIEGTGHSGAPSPFVHTARIVLRTTYVSYVAYAGSGSTDKSCVGFWLSFFPLNRSAQFELRAIQYQGAGWSTVGGVSNSIGCVIGDCLGGFPGSAGCGLGSGAIPGGGFGGCKAERAPAKYEPLAWRTACPAFPFEFIYKLTSNAPLLWQLAAHLNQSGDDWHTYAPATSLTYAGVTHYLWRTTDQTNQSAGYGTSLVLINTGLDPLGGYNPNLRTTAHLFRWDVPSTSWVYGGTVDIDRESQAYVAGTKTAEDGGWRIISSAAQIIVNQGWNTNSTLGCCCGSCANDFGHMVPTRETGNLVSGAGSGTFYPVVQGFKMNYSKVVVGNVGAADATYEVWKYVPKNTQSVPGIPSELTGNSGNWTKVVTETVPAPPAAGNPDVFSEDGPWFDNASLSLFRIKVTAGGPIQVQCGAYSYRLCSGGSMLHASSGDQTGTDFWFNQAADPGSGCGGCKTDSVQTLSAFCPRAGMAVRAVSSGGASATYTTTGPDQCVSFMKITRFDVGTRRNWNITVLPGPDQGPVIVQYIQCTMSQKGYTAPFLASGVHYDIITPPVVFAGQQFWITVVVVEALGGTKTNYVGITSFTSTDASAQMEWGGMNSGTYAWSGAENGVKVFIQVTLNVLGLQTIVATDTVDGSITGLAAIFVVGVDVKLAKEPRQVVGASGDTIGFRICWSNYSTASARSFTITDAVPMGTAYVPDDIAAMDCGNTKGSAVTVAYSTSTSAAMPASFTTITSGPPPAAVRWLRWTISEVGVNVTGCVCFKVKID